MPSRHDPPAGAHPDAASSARLAWVLALVTAYMFAEAAGGIASGSLALLADAGHMLADAASLGLALLAARIATRPAAGRRTYGYYRAEILAALANAVVLVAVSGGVAVEAVSRLRHAPAVDGPLALAVGAGGLVVNVASLAILPRREGATLNERGARLHVLFDLLGSVQVILAVGAVWAFGWTWADPVASLAIAVLVVASAWHLLRECTSVLLESAPRHIDPDDVRARILSEDGVEGVHDLHVWTIATGIVALSAHVGVACGADRSAILHALRDSLRTAFGIDHLTLEVDEGPCEDVHSVV